MVLDKRVLIIVIAVIVVVAIAAVLLVMNPGAQPASSGTTTSSPQYIGNNTSTSTSNSGLRTITTSSSTSSPTSTVNTSQICSVAAISPTITMVSSHDPKTGELVVYITISIDKLVEDNVVIKKITIDNPSQIVKQHPELVDMVMDRLILVQQKQAPATYTSNFRVPDILEEQWKPGTGHNVTIVYEYKGVECRTIETVYIQ